MKQYWKWGIGLGATLILLQLIDSMAVNSQWAATNRHMVFGLFFSGGMVLFLSILLSIIFLIAMIMLKTKAEYIALVMTGIVSNLLSRMIYGGAVDYIQIMQFPLFNLADILIVASIIYVFGSLIIKKSAEADILK